MQTFTELAVRVAAIIFRKFADESGLKRSLRPLSAGEGSSSSLETQSLSILKREVLSATAMNVTQHQPAAAEPIKRC